MTLALVRHGRTPWNLERRMQGRSDIPLDEVGRAQADAAGRLLAEAVWHRVVSSPLQRAVLSAEIIRRHVGDLPFGTDPVLLERDYGDADGLPVAEAWERWPDGEYPGSEPVDATRDRAAGAFRSLARAEGSTIVVAHGALLRAGIQALTGSDCPRIGNGEVVLLETSAAGRFIARSLSG